MSITENLFSSRTKGLGIKVLDLKSVATRKVCHASKFAMSEMNQSNWPDKSEIQQMEKFSWDSPVMNMLQPTMGIKKLLVLLMNLKGLERWNNVYMSCIPNPTLMYCQSRIKAGFWMYKNRKNCVHSQYAGGWNYKRCDAQVIQWRIEYRSNLKN